MLEVKTNHVYFSFHSTCARVFSKQMSLHYKFANDMRLQEISKALGMQKILTAEEEWPIPTK